MEILLVDDEAGALEALADEVEEAVSEARISKFQLPLAALSYAERHQVDIAFLDVEMPQMNGLELARKLKKTNPNMNVIFVTAYDEYGMDAIKLRASGYLLKPASQSDVREEIRELRYPIAQKQARIYARTFGQFDLLVDGKTVQFHRLKSKEVLAYLIDRKGGTVTKRELASVIFEDREYDRTVQDYLNKLIRDLDKTLKEAGAESLMIRRWNSYAVDTKEFQCDLYEYERGVPQALNAFKGEYMKQYTWAEETLGLLY